MLLSQVRKYGHRHVVVPIKNPFVVPKPYLINWCSIMSTDLSTWCFCWDHLGLAAWCGIFHLLKIIWRSLDVFLISHSLWRWEVVSLTFTPYPFFFVSPVYDQNTAKLKKKNIQSLLRMSSFYHKKVSVNVLWNYMYIWWRYSSFKKTLTWKSVQKNQSPVYGQNMKKIKYICLNFASAHEIQWKFDEVI